MDRIIRIATLALAVTLAAADPGGAASTGTTRSDPLAVDDCPEEYPELDPADPVGTLYAPEPDPDRDICATWVTAHWDDVGPAAELTSVTFGLEVLGDIALRPDRAYEFTWNVPAPEYESGTCSVRLSVTDGSVVDEVSLRYCVNGSAPLVPWIAEYAGSNVGTPVPATVTTTGGVLEVVVSTADAPDALAEMLSSGATLGEFCPVAWIAEPWPDDTLHSGDVTFVPPEPT